VNKLVLIDSQVLGLSAATDTQSMLRERAKDPRFKAAVKVVSTFLSEQANFAQNDESLEFLSIRRSLFISRNAIPADL
jgi:proline iminopeptidase